jgi:hypothetical protein
MPKGSACRARGIYFFGLIRNLSNTLDLSVSFQMKRQKVNEIGEIEYVCSNAIKAPR